MYAEYSCIVSTASDDWWGVGGTMHVLGDANYTIAFAHIAWTCPPFVELDPPVFLRGHMTTTEIGGKSRVAAEWGERRTRWPYLTPH
jgi:hypothetical protein